LTPGFTASGQTAGITSEDNQNVIFNINTNCDKIARMGHHSQKKKGPLMPIRRSAQNGPAVIMTRPKKRLRVVVPAVRFPVGLFKAMQVCRRLGFAKRH